MRKNIITISREFGSGGRTIGKEVAKRLNIPFYDKELIEKIIGCKLKINKDKNQRIECGCVESVEVGTYNTCKNGCVYCYANYSAKSVESNFQKYDPLSPLLCGHIEKDDKISTRKVVLLKETQISIFDI